MASKLSGDDTVPWSDDAASAASDEGDSAFDRLLQQAARAPSRAPVLAPGTRLAGGRFEILRRIGEGGMGIVFEAFDATRRENVALKTMARLEARDVYQFKNEFRALGDIAHENLVRLHELSTESDLWYMTMELVRGVPFDQWVRPPESRTLERGRLLGSLPQLVEAIVTIHGAGKLHRDLKPSNVLVTPGGRVVVLDFGLAIGPEAGGRGQTVTGGNITGTPAYMAPEQAAGRALTAASDFYAFGVMLFEALTGRLPFDGTAPAMIVDKQREEAPRALRYAPDTPPELDELCAGLLARDPGARPDAEALKARFPLPQQPTGSNRSQRSSRRSGGGEHGASTAPEAAPELFGREDELSALRSAFEATLGGQAVVVFVSGESGMGKSALGEAFLYELRTQGRATVLSGRCYERENVPFKGFDSLVDDLSRHLRKLETAQAAALLPREVYALARLFPVLGRVQVVADAPKKEVPDALELRRRGYAAFGELLTRMRDRAPLCVHLDDAQWLDADAVAFMRALLVHPEPVPLLLLLSHRSEHAEANQALSRVRDAVEGNRRLELRTLPVGPLSPEAARELAARLMPEDAEAADLATAAVAQESGGSPFFIGELCRFVARHGADAEVLANLSLNAALGDHLSALAPPARRLLEHAALAGRPLPAALLLEAAQATHAELDLLRASRLLRQSNLDGERILECYHDKVHEAVAGAFNKLQRVSLYAALAGVLEVRQHPDPELLAACFEGAGESAAAAEHYARAADQAMAGTAFVHAADLYEKALALGTFEPSRVHTLSVALGEALSEAGRAKQAAELFLRAASDVQGEEHRALKRRAAEGLVTTGHIEEGMAIYRELFADVGLPLPSSSGAALRHLLWVQLRLRLRGSNYVPRDPNACSPRDREVLALYRSAHKGVNLVEPLIGAGLDMDYLLHALRAGVPEHVAVGLVYTAFIVATAEPSATERLTGMVDTAFEIARELGDPAVLAETEFKAGLVWGLCGRWKKSFEHLSPGLEMLSGNLRDVQPMLDIGNCWASGVASFLGDWRYVARTTPNLVEQSYSRDRLFVAICLSGSWGAPAWLHDDADAYQRVLDHAKRRWHPTSDVQWQDYGLALGEVMLHLYRSDSEPAVATIEQFWPALSKSLIARTQMTHCIGLHLRGLAALAKLRTSGDRSAQAIARDSAKRISRLALPWAPAMQSTLDAGLALHAGNEELGRKHLDAALAGFEASDMAMYTAAVRRRLGELVGGDEGRALLAQGDAAMHAQRVTNLDAVTEMHCAGCRAP